MSAADTPRIGRIPAIMVIAALVVAGVSIAMVRTSRLGGSSLPTSKGLGQRVLFEVRGSGDGRPATVSLALPAGRDGQRLVEETLSGDLDVELHQRSDELAGRNRYVTWSGAPAAEVRLRCELLVEGGIGAPVEVGELAVDDRARWLAASPLIQVGDERLADRVARNKVDEIGSLVEDPRELAERLFTWVRFDIVASGSEGDPATGWDALTTMRKEEGPAAAQARLLTALLRTAAIPARMVAGIRLQSGVHDELCYWVEAYLDGHWRPGDPYQGEELGVLPEDRLRIIVGEVPFFETQGLSDIGWSAEVTRQFHGYFLNESPPEVSLFSLPHELHGTLRNILLIPMGLLIVVLLALGAGLRTLDVLTPVLIGLVLVETTVPLGVALLLFAGGGAMALGPAISRFGSATLREGTVIMAVIGVLLFALWGFDRLGLYRPYLPGLFAMAVIVLVAERVLSRSLRTSRHETLLALAGTVAVGVLLAFVNQWPLLHQVLFAYPEAIFLALAITLAVGRFCSFQLLDGFYPRTQAGGAPPAGP